MRKEYDFSKAKRAKDVPALARLQKQNEGKERITIRLDADVLAWFRAQVKGGGSYAAMDADNAPLTANKLREILRQELHTA